MTIKSKKQIIILSIVALSLVVPLSASAGFFDLTGRALSGIATTIASFFIGLAVLLARGLSALAGGILDFVISPSFTEWGYTRNNPIIAIGLNITKQFVNMGLVAILIAISFMITLRIKEYDAKKLLTSLIIIALLVNFAPVLVGLIVDASNIIMNYFLEGISEGVSGTFTSAEGWSSIYQDMKTIITGTPAQHQAIVTKGVSFIAINLVLFIIFTIYALLFICRYMALWMLTILSPLAFIAWILPSTKKFWTMWWNQVIQWSFIGVTTGFFLYLSVTAFGYINSYYRQPKLVTSGMDSTFMSTNLTYLTIIAFMIMGLIYGLKTSAAGASSVIGFGKKLTVSPQKWLYKKSKAGIGGYLKDARTLGKINMKSKEERIASGRGKLDPRRYIKGFSRLTTREAAAGLSRRWDKFPYARALRPEALDSYGQHLEAMEREGAMTGPTPENIERVDNNKFKGSKAAKTVFDAVKTRGDSQDVIKHYGKKYNHMKTGADGKEYVDDEALLSDERFIKDKNLNKVMDYLSRSGKRGTVERMESRLAVVGNLDCIGNTKEAKKARNNAMMNRIINSKPGDISNQERELHENEQVMEIAMATRGEDYIRALMNQKGGAALKKHTMENIYSKWIQKTKRSTKNDDKTRKENNKAFWEYLGKEYNVKEPPMERAFENKNIRSKLGIDEIGFSYKTEAERALKPGSVLKAVTSDVSPEVEENIEKDRNWNKNMAAKAQEERQARKDAENAEKKRKAQKNKNKNPETGLDNKRNRDRK